MKNQNKNTLVKAGLALWSCLSLLSANGQSLESFLLVAEQNSPELQVMEYHYQSALEKINEAGSLPDTKIGAGYFVQEPETRVGAQRAKLTAIQMLPWFGTLEAQRESATAIAETELQGIEIAKRKLFLKVKQRFFELYEKQRTAIILRENLTILETFETLALSELENDRSSMVDVLKLQMEKNVINNKIASIDEVLNSLNKAFNLVLNRNTMHEVIILDSLFIDTEMVNFSKEQLLDHPKLIQLDAKQKAVLQSELVARKQGQPNIGVGLDYVVVEEREAIDLFDNGKDIVMPMITVTIPLFSKKYISKQKQLQLQQQAIGSGKLVVKNELEIIFENALSQFNNARRTVKTQRDNIYQAEQTQKVILATYQTAKLDFEQILEMQQLLLTFRLEEVKSITAYFNNKSVLEFLTQQR